MYSYMCVYVYVYVYIYIHIYAITCPPPEQTPSTCREDPLGQKKKKKIYIYIYIYAHIYMTLRATSLRRRALRATSPGAASIVIK